MPFFVRISGEYACFPRPEFVRDRITYDVIPPYAARAILEAIYWRPQLQWRIDTVHILSPIRIQDMASDSRMDADIMPRRTIALRAVDYVIEAHFDLIESDANPGNPAQHTKMFLTRARQGRYFRTPFLGQPEFPAKVSLVEKGAPLPQPYPENIATRDLGWMAHDSAGPSTPLFFFRALMDHGRIIVPPLGSSALAF